jgi:hypothetical protein
MTTSEPTPDQRAAWAGRDRRIRRWFTWGTLALVAFIVISVVWAMHNTSGDRSCRQKTQDAGLSPYSGPGVQYERLCLQQEGRR